MHCAAPVISRTFDCIANSERVIRVVGKVLHPWVSPLLSLPHSRPHGIIVFIGFRHPHFPVLQ
jgi:hypothetical protein